MTTISPQQYFDSVLRTFPDARFDLDAFCAVSHVCKERRELARALGEHEWAAALKRISNAWCKANAQNVADPVVTGRCN